MAVAAESLAISGGPQSFDADVGEFAAHPVMECEEIGAVVGLPVFWNRTPTYVLDRMASAVAKVLGNLDALR